MDSKIQKETKGIFIVCVILFLGFLIFDVFSFLGIDLFTYCYIILTIPVFAVLIIVSFIILVENYKNFSRQNFLPLVIVLATALIMSAVLCITPGNIASHKVGLFFFSRELFNCPLPPDSEIILKGSEHGNSTGSSKHCENLAYVVISTNKSMDEIKNFYKSKLSNKTDNESLEVYLFNKDKNPPFERYFLMFSFTKEQMNQLRKAEGKKRSIYLVSVVQGCYPTCFDGS